MRSTKFPGNYESEHEKYHNEEIYKSPVITSEDDCLIETLFDLIEESRVALGSAIASRAVVEEIDVVTKTDGVELTFSSSPPLSLLSSSSVDTMYAGSSKESEVVAEEEDTHLEGIAVLRDSLA